MLDANGNLFGTAAYGGANRADIIAENGGGTIFQLVHGGGGWQETVLYNFCSQPFCTDGFSPESTLVEDATGNLFGGVGNGLDPCSLGKDGEPNCGLIMELSPAAGGGWIETVLHTFCTQQGCPDGSGPQFPALALDASGNLFGETLFGGGTFGTETPGGGGVLFEVSGGTFTVLQSFCGPNNSGCTDGFWPYRGGAMIDAFGDVVGTTSEGGGAEGFAGGVAFKVTP
jgi:hypothetical protein